MLFGDTIISGYKRIVVCANLYPVEQQPTRFTNTFAIRELVEGLARGEYVDLEVVKIGAGLNRKGVSRPAKTLVNGIPVYDVPKIGFKNLYIPAGSRAILYALGLDCAADVFVCHMAKQFIWAYKIFNKPESEWIFVLHSSDFNYQELGQVLNLADKVLVRSEALRLQLEKRFNYLADGVAFSGVEESIYSEPSLLTKKSEDLKLIVVAKLIELKNIEAVLEAIARISTRSHLHVQLDIYGEGHLKESLRRRAKVLGIDNIVVFHGFREREVILEAMDKAQLLLMPSAPETFGLAYLEAMARGCVVLGHEGWGIDGVVEDKLSGYIVAPPLVDAICDRIEHYLLTDQLAMRKRSFACARNYSKELAVTNYSRLILG